MIPVKLTLQGVQSYRERQEIDFNRLTSAGLFGVFGKVGSGKSTILEAITFCLFGDTERLNNRENRSYNLMNLRSDRLYLDFEFRTGRDQTAYRFVVEAKRNGRQFDKVTLERKAYQWMPELNDWSPIAAENPAERIIGLSYENFKRTVIIPQGRFQEFIELRDADRTRMMKELFQLERFELSDRTKTLNDLNNNELARIGGMLQSLGEVTQEMLIQTNHDLQNTQQLLAVEKTQLTQKREEEKRIEDLKKLFDKLLETNERLQKLDMQEALFSQRKQRLGQYESFLMAFKPLFDEQQRLVARTQVESVQLSKKQTEFVKIEQVFTNNQQKLDELRPRYAQRDSIQLDVKELYLLLQIKQLEIERNKLQARIEEGEIQLKAKTAGFVLRQQKYQQLKEERTLLRKNVPDLARLADVRKWFDTKERLVKEREKFKSDANLWVEQQKAIEGKKQQLFNEAIAQWMSPTLVQESYETIFAAIKTTQNELLKQIEGFNTQLIHFQTKQALQQYAGALVEGELCPLCGSVHHPAVLKADTDWQTAIQAITDQQNKLKSVVNHTLTDFSTLLTGLQKEWQLIENQKKQLKETIYPDKIKEINEHEQGFIWTEFDSNQRESIDTAWRNAEQAQQKMVQLEKVIEIEEKAIENEEAEIKTKFEAILTALREEIAAKNGAIESTSSQLHRLSLAEWVGVEIEQIRQKAQRMELDIQAVVKDFEALEKNVQEQSQVRSSLEGELKTLTENNLKNQQEQAQLQTTIRNALQQHGGVSEDSVKEVLALNLDITTERNAIQQYEMEVSVARIERDNLQVATEGKTLDAEYYKALLEAIEAHEKEQNRLSQEIGRLTDLYQKQNQQIEQLKELLTEKAKLEVRKNDLETMSKLFRSSGFVNYVSSVYLQNLCNQANERFHRMTRQQLQLEVTETNNFQVRDLLNDGKTRALNTLSGGQKFQAALALSLALADNVHAQVQAKENFFFLDEGFGSLDKESLQTVFDTLKSLRKENRIVGVISHVEDLQQEIDCYLSVVNDSERGSLIAIGG